MNPASSKRFPLLLLNLLLLLFLLPACSDRSAEPSASPSAADSTTQTDPQTGAQAQSQGEAQGEAQAASQEAAIAAKKAQAEVVARAGAPLFEGMGDHQHPITTSDPWAQKYFNQGMVLDFAFNHAESARSFKAAQTLDANCAMCYWGEALALGPNINVTSNGKATMTEQAQLDAYAAIQKAVSLKGHASEQEADYIDALAVRYTGDPASARAERDLAYADAMRGLYQKYPEDDDAAALFAEALMTTMPWDYWLDPDNPKPGTVEVIDALETVLQRSPKHPMALHLYIHAVEASSNPGRAESAADALAFLVPGAGHLVHMPSHLFWRVGRYHDASEANLRAAAVDEAYIAQCNAQGFYPAMYYPHNIHFLWAASSMEGRSDLAIESARRVAANVRLEVINEFPSVEFFHTIPLLALTQFGRWNEVLQEPQPDAALDYSNAIWHYVRATAYARLGDLEAARQERAALVPLRDSAKVHFLDSVDYPASQLLLIADELALGEIARADNKMDEAVDHFAKAVAAQDALPYTEPPFWYYPTRVSLGHALLQAGNAAEAEKVFRRDMEIYMHNGWSMYGLIQSLQAQGKTAEAEEMQHHLDVVWAQADVALASARF
jgi:tetratricopeptide (TPR) repeat protein